MTTIGTLILLTIIAIYVAFLIHSNCVIKELKKIKYTQSGLNSKLQSILDVCNQQQVAWNCDVTTTIKLLKEIRNCLTEDINWGELSDSQKSEILYRFTHPVVESPFKPPFNPTCETTNKED